MRPLIHRFSSVWRTELGHKVRVELQDAPDVSQEADFQPRRIAVLEKTPLVHAGTVIYGFDTAYLLVNQVSLSRLTRYRALEITHHFPWVRQQATLDPVTGFHQSGAPVILNVKLPCVVEPVRVIEDRGIERAKMQIFSGADVQLGDKIGPYEVKAILLQLGVKLLEVF